MKRTILLTGFIIAFVLSAWATPANAKGLLGYRLYNHCASSEYHGQAACLAYINGYMSAWRDYSHFIEDSPCASVSTLQVSKWYLEDYQVVESNQNAAFLPANEVMGYLIFNRCK